MIPRVPLPRRLNRFWVYAGTNSVSSVPGANGRPQDLRLEVDDRVVRDRRLGGDMEVP